MEPLTRPARLRVLVVDDSEDMTATTAMVLRLWGHDVRTARDGIAACRSPRRSFLTWFCWTSPCVTGYSRPKDIERSLQAGFHRHIVKPFDPDELRELFSARNRAANAPT
jgi:CheY-like chemotaxis protein